MEVEKDKIKDLFSSKFASFEPEVPASVWGGLDQLLSNQPVPQSEPTSSSSASTGAAGNASLIKTIAVIVGLTIATAAGVFYLNSDKEKAITPAPKVEDRKEEIIDTVRIEEIDTIKYEPSIGLFRHPEKKKEEPVQYTPVIVEEEINEPDVEVERETKLKEKGKSEEVKENVKIESKAIVLEPEAPEKGFYLGVVANMGLFSSDKMGFGSELLFSRRVRSEAFLEALDSEGSEVVLEHKLPISVSVTVGKELSSRVSIETGLIYSYLSSNINTGSRFLISEKQSFSYIGFPISVNYTFTELGKTRVYASFGAMIQKDIKGEYVSNMGLSKPGEEQMLENELYYREPYYIKKSITQTNPQISARTFLGVAHPLYKKLYIYGAIGGIYYFDSNNKYRTIYSDKKFQLGLDLGVKYEF